MAKRKAPARPTSAAGRTRKATRARRPTPSSSARRAASGTRVARKPASRKRTVARKAAARKTAAKKVAPRRVATRKQAIARKQPSGRKPAARKQASTRAVPPPAPGREPTPSAEPAALKATGRPQSIAARPAPPSSGVAASAPPAAERRRAARTSLAPVDVDLTPEDADEPLVPGAPSSLVLDPRAGRARAVDTPEDELVAEGATDFGLRAGDADVNLQQAYSSGDETPGGDNPTPDQDIVDLIGRSLGVEYEDDEELRGAEKIADRDRRRWELDPASAEDFKDRKR